MELMYQLGYQPRDEPVVGSFLVSASHTSHVTSSSLRLLPSRRMSAEHTPSGSISCNDQLLESQGALKEIERSQVEHESSIIDRLESIEDFRSNGELELLDRSELASLLQGCWSLSQGKCLHAHIVQIGFDVERDTFLSNLLISLYGKCKALREARAVFDKMHQRSVVSWNAMAAAYCQQGCYRQALLLFHQMQQEGTNPCKISFINALRACANLTALAEGKRIHSLILQCGFDSDVIVGNALVTMYGKCGVLGDARAVLGKIHPRSIISWNAMIGAYAQHGHCIEALEVFQEMQQACVKPDQVTFLNVLNACASMAALSEGEAIHACLAAGGFESDAAVGTALINMYGKCGALHKALSVFDKMHQLDVVSWTAMITAYSQHGYGNEALQLFHQMQLKGLKPDLVTFVSTLSACASFVDLPEGREVHACILDRGEFESNIQVGNALINMYGKCGAFSTACIVFDKMHQHNIISWNGIIAAYALQGHGKMALHLFEELQRGGMKPDEVTFVNILLACSHGGLVHEAHHCFDSMSSDHGVTPTLEHYGCMIDLFGRAGMLDEAEDFIYKMPLRPDACMWVALLGACRMHGDVLRAERVAKHAMDLDPLIPAPYLLLSDMYAADGLWDSATNVSSL